MNGLLLRSDIHTLFDLDLIGIDPSSLKLFLNEMIKKDPEYKILHGKSLKLVLDKCRPSQEALELKWNFFLEKNHLHFNE